MDSGQPLFTGDDYQLVAESAYREEERIKLFTELHGFEPTPDGHVDRLADLCKRLGSYLQQHSANGGTQPPPA